jgi:protein O-GlcNAc transferase
LRGLDLDIAIDLAGHSTSNRLAVLARRVAPLQVCWLDWFDTTAVPAMDAWISDPWLTPADSTQRYSEHLVHLPSGRFCYTPISGVAPSCAREGDGPVVFGSFNRLAKLNDTVVATWARLLNRVPSSRLILRARLLDDAGTRMRIGERFAVHGIGIERLDLAGEAPYRDLLDAYRGVDITLDPFPFSGCATTCDALWMGCPTITLPGETFVSRQSASLAWRLGHDEWAAVDRDDYVERASALAGCVGSLRQGRSALRQRVQERLCNATKHASEFADLLLALHAAKVGEFASSAASR